MNRIQTVIGEHPIEIVCDSPETKAVCETLFSFRQSIRGMPELTVTVIRGDERPFTSYDVTVSKRRTGTYYERADFTIYVDSLYKEAFVEVHSELALKHAMMTLYSGFIVETGWGLLLHSSCVLEKDAAHLFTGQSGAGKSTAAMLSAPRALLSDEASILKMTESGVVIYDSPFRSEVDCTVWEGSYPLASVNVLHQSLTNQRIAMKQSEAFLTLIDKVFYWSRDERDVKQVIQLLQKLVKKTDIHHLYFKKDPTFWEMMNG